MQNVVYTKYIYICFNIYLVRIELYRSILRERNYIFFFYIITTGTKHEKHIGLYFHIFRLFFNILIFIVVTAAGRAGCLGKAWCRQCLRRVGRGSRRTETGRARAATAFLLLSRT